jgi:3-methyladenine DNA glycosylase Mpg
MFGEASRAYIYYGYGRHFCVNVSARSSEIQGGAVLIRALEPLEGPSLHEKTSDKRSQALSICWSLNGIDMTATTCDLRIEFDVEQEGIKATPRIVWWFVLLTGTESGNLTNKFAS